MLSYIFIRLQAYHKIISEHCQTRDRRLLRGVGDPFYSSQGTELNELTQSLARYGAEYYEDGEGASLETGTSCGEDLLVDDEDSLMHDVNEDLESSNGSENA